MLTTPDHTLTSQQRLNAAQRFVATGQWEDAIHHWLALGHVGEAVSSILQAAPRAIAEGRLASIEEWLSAIPDRVIAESAALQILLGNVLRLRSQFDTALQHFAQAQQRCQYERDDEGLRQALLGQVHVYLDTVRPNQAEQALEQALAIATTGQSDFERAELLRMLAENKLNLGKPAEAWSWLNDVDMIAGSSPKGEALRARILLRTGRMREAAHGLAELAAQERDRSHAPRGHREIPLLLSLIQACLGNAERATALAQEGIALGRRLGSPFIEAVGYIRLGHALQLRALAWRNPSGQSQHDLDDALHCYRTAVSMGDQMAARRLRSEAMWGLTRAHGLRGDLAQARAAAQDGLAVALAAGDIWIAGLLYLAWGTACVLGHLPDEAAQYLAQARAQFEASDDPLGQAASGLWQALAVYRLKSVAAKAPEVAASIAQVLQLVQRHDLAFLLTTVNMLGAPDPRELAPLLIMARDQAGDDTAAQTLRTLGLARTRRHAGYQLRIQTLGDFCVWRGGEMVNADAWKRTAARRMLWLLIAERNTWLPRDWLIETLWQAPDIATGASHFKVAFNALNRVLQPDRVAGEESLFVQCADQAYRLNPHADIWLDCAEFENACDRGDWQTARVLYRGDFLPMAAYEDVCMPTRQRLLARWQMAMDRLATESIDRDDSHTTLDLCEALLQRDACWENAYRLMMRAHFRRGDVAQVARVFQRCEAALSRELGVKPAASTLALLREMMGSGR